MCLQANIDHFFYTFQTDRKKYTSQDGGKPKRLYDTENGIELVVH